MKRLAFALLLATSACGRSAPQVQMREGVQCVPAGTSLVCSCASVDAGGR